ncbi:MAG: MalY/PatB family protein [Clostridia bacterium]|jgi:cystathionine beta-lyase
MKYDFDTIIDRRNTNCVKYDFMEEHDRPKDVIPLWVADMDFQTAPAIIERLKRIVEHGIYGYSGVKADYFKAVERWFSSRFAWKVQEDWLVRTPGVVYAIATSIQALTKEKDAVLIQQPVYHPFRSTVLVNHRRLVNSPLVLRDGRYEIDFEDFENKIREENVKLFILCSPHNPVGRVWTREELTKIGEICLRHQVIVVSDEIHSDFIYPGHSHTVFASIDEAFAQNSITCTAPSKTFNLAGLQVSNIFIPNEELRKRFTDEMKKAGIGGLNVMALAACQAAYEEGEEWLEQLKSCLYENLQFIRRFLKEKLPQIRLIEPEGSYLIWLDFRGLGLNKEDLEDFIVNKAGLWLNAGDMFGREGEGFQRMNIACPRAILERTFHQLEEAVNSLSRES